MRSRILFPIGVKLIVLFSFLLGAVALSIIYIATKVFVDNNSTLVQQMTIETASQLAVRERKILEGYQSRLALLSRLFQKEPANPANVPWDWSSERALKAFFLFESRKGAPAIARNRVLSPKFDELEDPQGERILQTLEASPSIPFQRLISGDTIVTNLPFGEEGRFYALGGPYLKNESEGSTLFYVGLFEETELVEAFKDGDAITSFLVNTSGELLAPSRSLEISKEDLASHPLVKKFQEGQHQNHQLTFQKTNGQERRIGAYQTIGFSGLAVFSEVPEARALGIVHRVRYRAGLVAGIVLCVAFLFTYIFSRTLTSPIESLVRATQMISEGRFNIRLRLKGRDEVAHLGNAFNEMAAGLEERDRVKEVFNRFHNEQIANKILSGELKLGGERREAVVFFSDLRDFTKMSESLEPEKVVEMINEYFSRMVAVIHRHGGIVDKYVGDAIVGLWGIPLENPNAARSALSACLEMRKELNALNEIRLGRGQEPLRMGMGLHVGTVIVGNIGSDQRMEYTAIGDTMNLASRIQSMTKEYGEDLLVSHELASRVDKEFLFESKGTAFVRGKTQSVGLFKVLGYLEKGQKVLVESPFASYSKKEAA